MIDEDDIDAIRIFARAVEEEHITGVVEFHLLNRTLATAMSTLSQYHLDRAKTTFDSLDPAVRRSIAERAEAFAREEVSTRCKDGAVCEPGTGAPSWKRHPIGIIRHGKFSLVRADEPDFRPGLDEDVVED